MNLNIILPQDIYTSHLEIVNEIKFTRREIDIIAYLLSGKSAKTIATRLSISPKTIEAHMRNIMMKVECNSRDGIIDFIEKSKKLPLLKEYYLSLLIQASFEEQLVKIAAQISSEHPTCVIICWRAQEYYPSVIHYLGKHLKLAGIKTIIETRESKIFVKDPANNKESWNTKFVIYAVPEAMIEQVERVNNKKKEVIKSFIQKIRETPNSIVALFPRKDIKTAFLQHFNNMESVYNLAQENYYEFSFTILKRLLPNIVLDQIILDFKTHYDSICGTPEIKQKKLSLEEKTLLSPRLSHQLSIYTNGFFNIMKLRGRLFFIWSILSIGSFCIGTIIFIGIKEGGSVQNKEGKSKIVVRADLSLPTQTVFLNRPPLMEIIDKSLKGDHDIQTIALVGIGGAGKTTLARQYGHQQKANVVWEINAETRDTLINSFESLAYTLSKTEEEKKTLKELQAITEPKEREEKVVLFVKKKLKDLSNWILIYDNVEKFTDIQNYFPHDVDTWGQGKVILTTRDSNIQNNNHINTILHVTELTPQEKLQLFTKIMTNGSVPQLTVTQKEEAKKFLKDIPPFPLDVSIAAYYLKTTNVSYKKYLEHMNEHNNYFRAVQENVLKDATDYSKTRYSIIALSLSKIINESKDFVDLLLFLSLLDSQNIPRDLLNAYKNDVIVENFIYNLKKYSLITNELPSSPLGPVVSIHRSTQDISLNYLMKTLSLEKNNGLVQSIVEIFDKYLSDSIKDERLSKMEFLVRHCEKFLTHNSLLTENARKNIKGKMGCLYYHLRKDKEAKELLEESLAKTNSLNDKNYEQISKNLVYLGNIYMELGENHKAKNLLDNALKDYKEYFAGDNINVARDLAFMGDVYGQVGDYKKARDALEHSLIIYKKHPECQVGFARALGFIGNIYLNLGEYEKSKNALEQSYKICQQNISEAYMNVAWILVYLGNTYRALGSYERAKDILEQALKIYKKEFSEDHADVAWALTHLGNVYIDIGNFEKAKNLIEKSLKVHIKLFKEDNIRTSSVLFHLGKTYILGGNIKQANNLFEKSLIAFEKVYGKEHIETARILNSLGQTYLLENKVEKAENTLQKALKIFQQNNHPEGYISLEALAELCLKKSRDATKVGDIQQSKKYKEQAIVFLKKAQEITKGHLPFNAPSIIKISSKINEIAKERRGEKT